MLRNLKQGKSKLQMMRLDDYKKKNKSVKRKKRKN